MELQDSLSSIYTCDRDVWTVYPGHKVVHTVEIRKLSNGTVDFGSTKLDHKDQAALSTWLKEPITPVGSGDVAGVKLLLLETSDAPSGAGKEQRDPAVNGLVEQATDTFGIPLVAFSHILSWVPGFLRLRQQHANAASIHDDRITYGLYQLNLNFIWSYSSKQHITQGIIWYEERVQPVGRTIDELRNLKAYLEQPMYLAVCACSIAIRRIVSERREIIGKVQKVDFEIGTSSGYDFLGDQPYVKNGTEKHKPIPTQISDLSSLVVRLKYRMKAVGDFTSQLVEENLKSVFRVDAAAKAANPALCAQADAIDEMLQRMGAFATRMLDHAGGLQERTATQMTQILSLTSQQDQRYSRLLAVEGKRDSSSMYTIAAVTMVFLPGTFVASFFATPFFDWTASHISLVVRPHFWIYWAVTVPLTILTIVVWFLWTWIKKQRDFIEDEDALKGKYEHVQHVGHGVYASMRGPGLRARFGFVSGGARGGARDSTSQAGP